MNTMNEGKIKLIADLNVQLDNSFKELEGQLMSDFYKGFLTSISVIGNKKIVLEVGADEFWIVAEMSLGNDPKIKKPHVTLSTFYVKQNLEFPTKNDVVEVKELKMKIFIGNSVLIDTGSSDESYIPFNNRNALFNEYLNRFINYLMPYPAY